MSDNSERYILYRTVSSVDVPKGYVINSFVWGGPGVPLPIPSGTAITSDSTGNYPIGSIYTVAT